MSSGTKVSDAGTGEMGTRAPLLTGNDDDKKGLDFRGSARPTTLSGTTGSKAGVRGTGPTLTACTDSGENEDDNDGDL